MLPIPPLLERTIHDAATWYMVGVIWLVQLVHYPMMKFLDRSAFARSHAFHTSAIGFVVMPAMLMELGLSATILWRRGWAAPAATTGFLLTVVIWAVTFLVMVPMHGRLGAHGFTPEIHQPLVRWNWVRTAAWTLRGLVAASGFDGSVTTR